MDDSWRLRKALSDIAENAVDHRDKRPDLRMIVEEIGELAKGLAGDHEHSARYELVQIGGIAANWAAQLDERT